MTPEAISRFTAKITEYLLSFFSYDSWLLIVELFSLTYIVIAFSVPIIIFLMKPEDSQIKRSAIMFCAIFFFWFAMNAAVTFHGHIVWDIMTHKLYNKELHDTTLRLFGSVRANVHMFLLGGIYGCVIAMFSDLYWRFYYRRELRALPRKFNALCMRKFIYTVAIIFIAFFTLFMIALFLPLLSSMGH